MKLSLVTSFIIAAVGSAGPCVLVTNATEHHPRYVASAAGLMPSAVQTDAATGVGNPKPEAQSRPHSPPRPIAIASTSRGEHGKFFD